MERNLAQYVPKFVTAGLATMAFAGVAAAQEKFPDDNAAICRDNAAQLLTTEGANGQPTELSIGVIGRTVKISGELANMATADPDCVPAHATRTSVVDVIYGGKDVAHKTMLKDDAGEGGKLDFKVRAPKAFKLGRTVTVNITTVGKVPQLEGTSDPVKQTAKIKMVPVTKHSN